MSTPIGFSFSPDSQDVRPGQSGPRPNGPQSAVEVKSFRIPNRTVPGQIAPQALLQSPGGGGQSEMQLLRQLMAAFAPQGQQPSIPSIPTLPSSQGGSDNYSGWRGNEPSNGGRGAPSGPQMPAGVPYDSGTGFNPIPPRDGGFNSQPEVPLSPPSFGSVPGVTPGQLAPDPSSNPGPDTWGVPAQPDQGLDLSGMFPKTGGDTPYGRKFDEIGGLWDSQTPF